MAVQGFDALFAFESPFDKVWHVQFSTWMWNRYIYTASVEFLIDQSWPDIQRKILQMSIIAIKLRYLPFIIQSVNVQAHKNLESKVTRDLWEHCIGTELCTIATIVCEHIVLHCRAAHCSCSSFLAVQRYFLSEVCSSGSFLKTANPPT